VGMTNLEEMRPIVIEWLRGVCESYDKTIAIKRKRSIRTDNEEVIAGIVHAALMLIEGTEQPSEKKASSTAGLIERSAMVERLGKIPHYFDEEYEALVSVREIRKLVELMSAVDAVPVIRCKDCRYCRTLGDGHSFECVRNDMEFYAPTYDAATYYCADAERRDDDADA